LNNLLRTGCRDDSISALASRHLIVRQAPLGSLKASSFTEIG
jgi:hypothetical protein